MKLMCDPPSGWKYGFPKPLPKEAVLEVNQNIGIRDKFDVMAWLVEEGYPQEEIDLCGEHFWLRYWEERTEADTEADTENGV